MYTYKKHQKLAFFFSSDVVAGPTCHWLPLSSPSSRLGSTGGAPPLQDLELLLPQTSPGSWTWALALSLPCLSPALPPPFFCILARNCSRQLLSRYLHVSLTEKSSSSSLP
uniref:Uncharacterized protein n=1 Tax=Arundo donax TaxID=35708 RepID=A0A0A8ZU37_ARUDO